MEENGKPSRPGWAKLKNALETIGFTTSYVHIAAAICAVVSLITAFIPQIHIFAVAVSIITLLLGVTMFIHAIRTFKPVVASVIIVVLSFVAAWVTTTNDPTPVPTRSSTSLSQSSAAKIRSEK